MRRLAIMQPTFLPWAGYFNLLAQVDDFVFLDDVQLEKQSWQTRNRLVINGCAQWVSVPICHGGLDQTILETRVVPDRRWRQKLWRTVTQNYGKHPHFADARGILDVVMESEEESLAKLNEEVIVYIKGQAGIQSDIHVASGMNASGKRTEKLIDICRHLGADEYVSPVGAKAYLTEDGFEGRAPCSLVFQDFTPSEYPQKGVDEFIPNLSIVDVVANIGWNGLVEYVR
jgi:hypothetical protein